MTTGPDRPVAFVTGASRGIGKAIARHLARAGCDVAIAARTRHEGEAREHSSTVAASNTRPLPGSLESTASEVVAEGGRALPVYLDLLDRTSLGASVTAVLERWGRIDILVNNGRYVGPGHMDQLLDTPVELLDRQLEANVIAPVILTKLVLPQMVERGSGIIINLASSSGTMDPPRPAGSGGWGLGYGMSKGALHRLAGMVAVELHDRGILAFNLSPGFVATERIAIDMAEFGFDASVGAPPDVVGAVAAWLVTSPDAAERNGGWIEAQEVCAALGLLPGWPATTS
ncbi:MAG TPA: SDR family NAD(P)-dependent oxidoreductase [Acidimicrobiales bacterium]|nr:SDR family NAD(P)-dependent oxidoreductase [Acidimicrobiales bacterium]